MRITASIFPRFLMLAALLLAGCQTQPPPREKPLSFTRYVPISLDVARIDINEDYKSPMREPNVEHLLPYSPAEAMRIWVKDRLRAVGTDKYAQVIIKDASVIATELPKPEGMGSMFAANNRRYDAKLTVEIRIYGSDSAMSEASVEVSASRSTTIPEKINILERKAIFNRMIYELMEMLNSELEKNIYTYFGNYISYSQNP